MDFRRDFSPNQDGATTHRKITHRTTRSGGLWREASSSTFHRHIARHFCTPSLPVDFTFCREDTLSIFFFGPTAVCAVLLVTWYSVVSVTLYFSPLATSLSLTVRCVDMCLVCRLVFLRILGRNVIELCRLFVIPCKPVLNRFSYRLDTCLVCRVCHPCDLRVSTPYGRVRSFPRSGKPSLRTAGMIVSGMMRMW